MMLPMQTIWFSSLTSLFNASDDDLSDFSLCVVVDNDADIVSKAERDEIASSFVVLPLTVLKFTAWTW